MLELSMTQVHYKNVVSGTRDTRVGVVHFYHFTTYGGDLLLVDIWACGIWLWTYDDLMQHLADTLS